MVDREERDRWVEILKNKIHHRFHDDSGACDTLQAEIAEWEVTSQDQTLREVIGDLAESLTLFLPVSPDGHVLQQALTTHQHTIRRSILLLQSDYEFPGESWLAQWWLLLLLTTGVGALLGSQSLQSRVLEWIALIALGSIVAIVWLGSLFQNGRSFWQIAQVRLMRRDLTAASTARDQAGHRPFPSHAEAQLAEAHAVTREKGSRFSP